MTIMIIFLSVVFIVNLAVARYMNRGEKELLFNSKHRLETTQEWCEDSNKLSDWRLVHPMGPINEKEHVELEVLVSNHVGSYMADCAVHDMKIDFEYIDHLHGLVEFWRD
jgi:hypothetical protein